MDRGKRAVGESPPLVRSAGGSPARQVVQASPLHYANHMRTAALIVVLVIAAPAPADPLPGFRRSPWFGEQVRERWVEGTVRVLVNAPEVVDPKRPTRLVVYATPNGNTIEQTLGCATTDGLDWHFDIQHVAAQVRRLRELSPRENIVLAVVEAEGLSWPAWRRSTADSSARIVRVLNGLRELVSGLPTRIALTGHSGGGSFIFGFIEAADAIPDSVDRIAFLDANYSFDADKHAGKLLTWLRGDGDRQLSVVAYDDRSITLDGKPVVGKDGGTFRATRRMLDAFAREIKFSERVTETFEVRTALDGRITVHVHPNPKNRILHTALVGDMNGLLRVLTDGDSKAPTWGTFGGPRAYSKWVQAAAGIPPRPADAEGGTDVFKRLAGLKPAEREEAIARELLRGNLPDFLRKFRAIPVRGQDRAGREHSVTFEVMPDYLAIGSDTDFVRVPMTPQTAQRVADAFGCTLPTRKIVDAVHRTATVQLDPVPLTESREAVETFSRHNGLIEKQRGGRPLGELVSGVKKDVVVTNRLGEKPNRVAIYGWHRADGVPIQPLTIVHRDTYVDYSHGVRLMKRSVTVNNKPRDIRHALHAPDVSGLLSDEGPIDYPSY